MEQALHHLNTLIYAAQMSHTMRADQVLDELWSIRDLIRNHDASSKKEAEELRLWELAQSEGMP